MSGETLTYYDVLRVPRRAEPARVRSAYRRLAQQYHPDKMPGDARARQFMAALNEAYAVLSDPGQRARYDQELDAVSTARARARESFIARLEDAGAAWPWYVLFGTISFATAAVSLSMWPTLLAGHLR
jgi:curved DNA-binding protein CbpA